MPAAAVIPAPRAYINVVAVKKPVVGFENITCVAPLDLVRPGLGIPEAHYGDVLLARGNGCRSSDHHCEEDHMEKSKRHARGCHCE